MKQESCSSHRSIFCTGVVIIHHDSVLFQEAYELVLEQVIYSISLSFALVLGRLWSFLIPGYLLPQSLSLQGCHTCLPWACQFSHVAPFPTQHCQNANKAGFIEWLLLVKYHYGLVYYIYEWILYSLIYISESPLLSKYHYGLIYYNIYNRYIPIGPYIYIYNIIYKSQNSNTTQPLPLRNLSFPWTQNV